MPRVDNVRQLVEHFERTILSGEYAPGDLLPPERAISDRMGVSRSVVREALGRLAGLGLVRSQHGSGTRVIAPDGQEVTAAYQRLLKLSDFRLEHLAEVRLLLETTIARLAASSRTDEHLARMDAAQKVLANTRRSLETHVEADLEFHAALADATGNPLFRMVLAPIQQLLIESRRRTLGRYGSELAHRHHARILDAVRAGDPGAAEEAMGEHLQANSRHLHEVADTPQV
jgi:DNA-binding FadR family transcriptional regulator